MVHQYRMSHPCYTVQPGRTTETSGNFRGGAGERVHGAYGAVDSAGSLTNRHHASLAPRTLYTRRDLIWSTLGYPLLQVLFVHSIGKCLSRGVLSRALARGSKTRLANSNRLSHNHCTSRARATRCNRCTYPHHRDRWTLHSLLALKDSHSSVLE